MSPAKFVREIAGSVSSSCRGLVVTDLLFKLLTFLLLTPMFMLLFRGLLMLAGRSVLSDIDIAIFFAGPFGWFSIIVLGAMWLGIIALEQAALLAIMAACSTGTRLDALGSLRFAAGCSVRIVRVTSRMIGWGLLTLAPFLAIAVGVYFLLLDEYDINYYLNQRPSEFRFAVAVGVVLVCLLSAILLRLCSSWFLVLPLVLFDNVAPRDALSKSAKLVSGHRPRILIWLVTWFCLVTAVNMLSTVVIGGAGRLLIPATIGSLMILATRIGLMLVLLATVGLVLNLMATIAFAGMLLHGYRLINPGGAASISNAPFTSRPAPRIEQVLTQQHLLAAGVIGTITVAMIGYWSLSTIRLEDDVQIMAHRGASAAAPENTMAAMHAAIDDGADWVEIDVQETADGEVVVLHDSDFMKLSGNPLKIWNASTADLGSIDIGSWFDPQFADERVPTLADVLGICKNKVGVNIELKYYGHDQQLEQRVVEIVEKTGMAEQVMVMSLKPEGVAKIKSLRPDWKCGLLISVSVGDLKSINADFLAVNAGFATRNFVRRAHLAGKQVFVWTVNDAAMMSRMLNRQVDGILTDRPNLARQVLAEREKMSTSERLLAEISIVLGLPSRTVEQ